MSRGRFIAFEGGEGMGKSTQARLLADWLQRDGIKVELTREPGGTPGAEAIRNLLLSPPGEGWTPEAEAVVRDSVGNVLADGDTVTVIKDLKVKGSSAVVKVGTKVRGIRLVAGDHDIDCRVPGIGQMGLKSAFVKKVSD